MMLRYVFVFIVAVFVSTILLITSQVTPELYIALTEEGKNLEFLTAIFYLLGGISLLYVAAKQRKVHLLSSIFILLLGLFFIFIGGEEESWGQWMFNYDVSESVKQINTQDEINIHNLNIFKGALNPHFVLNLFIFLFGVVLPILAASIAYVRELINDFQFPIVSVPLSAWFLISLLYEKIAAIVFTTDSTVELWRHIEIMEFLFSVGILAFSISLIKSFKGRSKPENPAT